VEVNRTEPSSSVRVPWFLDILSLQYIASFFYQSEHNFSEHFNGIILLDTKETF
jgi:hypothetical protein